MSLLSTSTSHARISRRHPSLQVTRRVRGVKMAGDHISDLQLLTGLGADEVLARGGCDMLEPDTQWVHICEWASTASAVLR